MWLTHAYIRVYHLFPLTCTHACDCFPNLSTVRCDDPELWCRLAVCCLWIAGLQRGGANLIRTLGQWSAAHKAPPDPSFALSFCLCTSTLCVPSCFASWWIIIHFCTYNIPFVGCYCWVLLLGIIVKPGSVSPFFFFCFGNNRVPRRFSVCIANLHRESHLSGSCVKKKKKD